MKIKTAEATGQVLDWLVAKAVGYPVVITDKEYYAAPASTVQILRHYRPSTNREQGYEIIERESISIIRCEDDYKVDRQGFTTNKRIPVWAAKHGEQHEARDTFNGYGEHYGEAYEVTLDRCSYGPTPLVAGFRCLVINKLGEEVDVPEELLLLK